MEESMIRRLLGFSLLTLFSIGIYLYFFLGFAKSVDIRVGNIEPSQITLSQFHVGPYHEILPAIEATERWAKENGVSCPRSFGHYLDDPSQVESARLRSFGGCVLEGPLPPGIKPDANQYQVSEIPAARYLIADFEGAPSIGPFIVYPKVREFAEKNSIRLTGDVFEIYDIQGRQVKTRYLFSMTP